MGRLTSLLEGSFLLSLNSIYVNVMARDDCSSLRHIYEKYIKSFSFGNHNETTEQINQIINLIAASGYELTAFTLPVAMTYLCTKLFKEAISPTQE